jgi:hypothetical protein
VIFGPSLLEIFSKLFDGRVSGTGAAVGDDDPGGDADKDRAEDGGYAFQVIHIKLYGGELR